MNLNIINTQSRFLKCQLLTIFKRNQINYLTREKNMNRKGKILSIILMSFLILLGTIFYSVSNNSSLSKPFVEEQIVINNQKSLVESGDISITSDQGFISYGCPGDGSRNNPYIIENLNNSAFSSHTGILVEGTTAHFIIRNCFIGQKLFGIQIEGIANGTGRIENNFLKLNSNGIYVRESNGIEIISNSGLKNNNGIYVRICYYVTVRDNHFIGVDLEYPSICRGITLGHMRESIISNNILTNCNNSILVYNCLFNNIVNNTSLNNSGDGAFHIENCFYNNIIGNHIHNNTNGDGLFLEQSSNNIIIYNNIDACLDYGISLSNFICSNNLIHHNNLIDNIGGSTTISQGMDQGHNNTWYNEDDGTGNYWSNWDELGNYEIDGSALSLDIYPTNEIIDYDLESITIPSFPSNLDDSFEQNDQFMDASYIDRLNITYSLIGLDDDYYKIYLQGTNELEITVNFDSSEAFDVNLYTENKARVAYCDDNDNPLELSFDCLSSGYYYIHVFPWEIGTSQPEYSMTVTLYTGNFDDEFEENDEILEATKIEITDNSYNLKYTDRDYFNITLEKGYRLRVSITFSNIIIDLELYLITFEDLQVERILAKSESQESIEEIEYKIPLSGNYYLLVQNTMPDGIPIIPTEYTLTISHQKHLGFPFFVILPVIGIFVIYTVRNKRKTS